MGNSKAGKIRDLGKVEGGLIELVDAIIKGAILNGSKLVRFSNPSRKKVNVYESDGHEPLRRTAHFPLRLRSSVVARLKIMANVSISVHRMAQTGTINFQLTGEMKEVKMMCIPTIKGDEDIVLTMTWA